MTSDNTGTARVVATPFELTFDDYNAIHLNQPRNRIKGWRAHAIVIVMALLNIGLSLWFAFGFDGPLFGIEAFNWVNALLGLGLLFLSYVVRPIVTRRHYAATGYKGTKISFEADAEAMRSSREGLASEIRWDGLVAWSETDDRFFFWINKLQAVIVPKHALDHHSAYETLRSFAQNAGVART